jgi:hypothetical protein
MVRTEIPSRDPASASAPAARVSSSGWANTARTDRELRCWTNEGAFTAAGASNSESNQRATTTTIVATIATPAATQTVSGTLFVRDTRHLQRRTTRRRSNEVCSRAEPICSADGQHLLSQGTNRLLGVGFRCTTKPHLWRLAERGGCYHCATPSLRERCYRCSRGMKCCGYEGPV